MSPCATCHSTDAWKPATFDHGLLSSSEMGNCATCHQAPEDDMHRGNKENCSSYHGTNAWSPSTFDHARYFLLEGDHNAKCATCHQDKKYNTYSCYGCHEHTPGNILQEHQEEGILNIADCVRCHRSGDEDDIRGGGEGGGSGEGQHDDD